MKRLSNWFIGVWFCFCSLLQFWPDAMVQVWAFMPDDLKSAAASLGIGVVFLNEGLHILFGTPIGLGAQTALPAGRGVGEGREVGG